nr:uncharacterized protein LOC125421001 [Ziziphus jujuba var. spinosa]
MPALFFQKYWDIVGEDMVVMVQNIFRSGFLSRVINRSFMVLIPKVNGVSKFKWIGENVVVVNEVLHSMKRKKGFWGLLGIKIDMQNAYDIVNWCFRYNLDGKRVEQGDPLSPFLFIIMMELLSRMLFKWERKKKFHGVKLGRMAPSISHSLFTDDLIIFCRANLEEVRNIKRCLQLYCKWSGQDFNKEKSGCFFSFNVELKIKAAIKICLGMKEVDKRAKHMGLPLTVGRSKTVAFEELKQ